MYSDQQPPNYPSSMRPWRENGPGSFRDPPHHWHQREGRWPPYRRGQKFGSPSGFQRPGRGSPSIDSRPSPSGSSSPNLQGYSPKLSPSKDSGSLRTQSESQPGQQLISSPVDKEDTEKSTKFSRQLHDPRKIQTSLSKSESQSDEGKHYTKSSKYTGFTKTPVYKRSAMLKQKTWKQKQSDKSKGPQLIQPHHQKSEHDKADFTQLKPKKSEKPKSTEVPLFPKPLASFKIPKHKSSSEIGKTTTGESRKTATEKGNTVESKDLESSQRQHAHETTSSQTKSSKACTEKEESKSDVASILSACDSTTLKALALTIQRTLVSFNADAIYCYSRTT